MTRATTDPPRVSKRELFRALGYQPHPGQVEVHRSRAARRVVACGVRWGKTLCAAMEGLAAAMEPRERSIGWVVAPTYDLSERVFSAIVVAAASHLRHRIVALKEHEHRLVLRNLGGGLSEIRGKSADNPVSLLGEGLDWVIVDEAARLRPQIWESHLSQRLLDRAGWAMLISTPRGKGYFYDLFRRGQGADPDYQSWNMPSWTSPMLDKEQIEEERGRLPERVFRQEYGGEFLEGAGQVFRNVRELATGEWQGFDPGKRYVAGLDLAKVEDYTVLVIVNLKREVCFVDRFHRLDWNLQVARIKAALDRYGKARVLVDSTGVGEPVYEALCRAGCNADGYALSAKSKAALIDNLSLLLEQRKVTLPRPEICPEMIDELEAFEYAISEQGNVRTGAPGGMHDDCVVALGLALWQARNVPSGPVMRVVSSFRELYDPRVRLGLGRARLPG
jgi:hypothetical protein